ncbi:hypothetical protein ACJJTC_019719, partial [Scirpophaga incertulas]
MKFACCKSTSEGAVGALICTTCNKNFHVACLYPTDKKKALSTEFKKAWICPDCTVNQPRLAKNDNTPVRVSQCTSRPVLSDNDNVNCRRGGSCSDSPPPSKQVDKKDYLVATPSIGGIVKSCIVTEMEVMRSELRAAISEAIARELKPIREEMVSALIAVSGYTACVNDGARHNAGAPQAEGVATEAVIIGIVGARLRREGYMESQDIVLTKFQSHGLMGYGLTMHLINNVFDRLRRRVWCEFYQ